MNNSITIEVKNSKIGQPVPVVNQIHLHSIYNPLKEADQLAQKNIDKVKENKNILILGLGFGYHVTSIQQLALQNHGNKYRIVVIEPIEELYEKCVRKNLISNNANLTVFTGSNIEKYFSNLELVNFLVKRPCIISHPASFNLSIDFFKAFLAYEAPQNMGRIVSSFQQTWISSYFSKFDSELTLEEALHIIKNKNGSINNNFDYLALAFQALVKA